MIIILINNHVIVVRMITILILMAVIATITIRFIVIQRVDLCRGRDPEVVAQSVFI